MSATQVLPAGNSLFNVVFVGFMIVFPLIVVAATPNRAAPGPERLRARTAARLVLVATVAALLLWIAVLVAARTGAVPGLAIVARLSWMLFFPLWFGLAMPALAARSPTWRGVDRSSHTRTASLVSRSRRSPITARHWTVMALAVGLLLAAIVARGWLRPFGDSVAEWRWLIISLCYAFSVATVFIVQPIALRAALREPEPLDAEGSPALVDLYDRHRRTRILGLFWLGALLTTAIGAVFLLAVWTDHHLLVAAAGTAVGVIMGIGGAAFGIMMSVRRARIEAFRLRLESGRPVT